MYLLLALAVVATVIMFFVDSDIWLNIAVIAALWAAFIGAVLVSRYSGALGEETTRAEERDGRRLAEMDAERAEHRRREAELELSFAERSDGDRDGTLESIRAELEAMRLQLSELSGVELTEEQVAVKARAERIIELERRSEPATPSESTAASAMGSSWDQPSSPEVPEPSVPETRRGGRVGGFATGSFSAVSWNGTDAEETSMIPLVVDTRNVLAADDSAPHGSHEAPATPAAPVAEEPAAPAEPEAPSWFTRAGTASYENPEPAPVESAEPTHHRRRAEEPDTGGHRRDADHHDGSGSVTVAELMAQLKKNAK